MIDGTPWSNMLRNHFSGQVDYKDSLAAMEKAANEKWATLVDFDE
jgi:hypothetical protein